MEKVNIAIDGPSGVGKSTVAKSLAENLNYFFVNTGSLYRAIAYSILERGIDPKDEEKVVKTAQSIVYTFDTNENVFIDGSQIKENLRSDVVSMASSDVAVYPKIREQVVTILQEFSKHNKGVIMDGRDTTFVVMPDAEVKIFLWAAPEIRATRRVKQNQELGFNEDYYEILEEIKNRDYQDMNRKTNPLHQTKDAILIDSTNMSEKEVFQAILAIVKTKVVENEKHRSNRR